MNLRDDLRTLLRRDVRLSQFTTMQVGGLANYFAEPSTEEELFDLLEFAKNENLPWMVLGKGSNVIFPDEGWSGLIITLIHYEQNRLHVDKEKSLAAASAGIYLYRFVLACRDQGLGGAEFLANIPGTIGGALVMNAGFSRFKGQSNEIGDIAEEVTVLNSQGVKETLARKDLHFSYRRSNLEVKVVLEGTFRLWRRSSEEIQKEIKANFDYRNTEQDVRFPSSGSIFKNPGPGLPSAGQMIDQLGLKGTRAGDAMVSLKHGNYMINAGKAKSSDLVALIRKVQKAVLDGTGILLEPEVRVIEKP